MSELCIVVSCPRGLEEVLVEEVKQITAKNSVKKDGFVQLEGNWADIYKLNIYSRIASRILYRLIHHVVNNEHDIYTQAKKIDWPHYFSVDKTFKIRIEGKRAKVNSLNFVALKIKDAVCDVFRERIGERPSVSKETPDIRISAFLDDKAISIYLDTSGEALFKRGWRQEKAEAPIRENLAAGLLKLAKFDGTQVFCDPMCGSGTIAIEAALIAKNQAPGLNRHFAFESFLNFDSQLLQAIKREAQAAIKAPSQPIFASDSSRWVLKKALNNAVLAKVDDVIRFSQADFINIEAPTEKGILLSNPPYGTRLGELEEIQEQYPLWSQTLKRGFSGWVAGFISADLQFHKILRLAPKRKIPLFNGKLECRLFLFDIVAGSNRKINQ